MSLGGLLFSPSLLLSVASGELLMSPSSGPGYPSSALCFLCFLAVTVKSSQSSSRWSTKQVRLAANTTEFIPQDLKLHINGCDGDSESIENEADVLLLSIFGSSVVVAVP